MGNKVLPVLPIAEKNAIIAVTPIPFRNKLGFYLFLRFIEFELENIEGAIIVSDCFVVHIFYTWN